MKIIRYAELAEESQRLLARRSRQPNPKLEIRNPKQIRMTKSEKKAKNRSQKTQFALIAMQRNPIVWFFGATPLRNSASSLSELCVPYLQFIEELERRLLPPLAGPLLPGGSDALSVVEVSRSKRKSLLSMRIAIRRNSHSQRSAL